MGTQDISAAEHPKRKRADGGDHPLGEVFRRNYEPRGRRYSYLWRTLERFREAPVNEEKTEIDDPAAAAAEIKAMALEMGADVVRIAKFEPALTFEGAEQLDHKCVVVFAKSMSYDMMVDIGPNSQEEVHRIYYTLNDIGSRLALRIGAFGYAARMHANGGEFPLPAYGQMSGLGELGKHGSLISPELGSSFRLCAVSTDMPLAPDGPEDYGIDEICTKCNICERFCPGDAIANHKKTVAGVTRWVIDTPACQPYFYGLYGCKFCLMVCPFNAKGSLKEAFKPVAADIRKAKDAKGLMAMIQERSNLSIDHIEDFKKQLAAEES